MYDAQPSVCPEDVLDNENCKPWEAAPPKVGVK